MTNLKLESEQFPSSEHKRQQMSPDVERLIVQLEYRQNVVRPWLTEQTEPRLNVRLMEYHRHVMLDSRCTEPPSTAPTCDT